MNPIPKHLKRLVREFAAIAHERELGQALSELRIEFDRWERRELSVFELNKRVHQFHQGPSRQVWARYATNHLESPLASAVAAGIVRKEELPAELLAHVAGLVEMYEQDTADS